MDNNQENNRNPTCHKRSRNNGRRNGQNHPNRPHAWSPYYLPPQHQPWPLAPGFFPPPPGGLYHGYPAAMYPGVDMMLPPQHAMGGMTLPVPNGQASLHGLLSQLLAAAGQTSTVSSAPTTAVSLKPAIATVNQTPTADVIIPAVNVSAPVATPPAWPGQNLTASLTSVAVPSAALSVAPDFHEVPSMSSSSGGGPSCFTTTSTVTKIRDVPQREVKPVIKEVPPSTVPAKSQLSEDAPQRFTFRERPVLDEDVEETVSNASSAVGESGGFCDEASDGDCVMIEGDCVMIEGDCVMIEGSSDRCGVYLPGKTKPEDLDDEAQEKPRSKLALKSKGKKGSLHKATLEKLKVAAENHFGGKERKKTTCKVSTSAPAKEQKFVMKTRSQQKQMPGEDNLFDQLDEMQATVGKTLASAYSRARSTHQDDEDMRALKAAGVLLPNGFTPLGPMFSEEGEEFLLKF